MGKFIVEAKRTHWYEVEVEAVDEEAALAALDDWIADDFEDFETAAQWDLEVIEN
jgi:phosphotransferase system HPr-like phosphotransfer protein